MAVSKRFEWLQTHMICWFRFSHQILMLINKAMDDSIETACVSVRDSKIYLKYSEKFFNTLKDACAVYVIYHELMHIFLHHCTSRNKTGKLWNIAFDLAANELIPEKPDVCERPPMGCFVSEYKKKYPLMKEKQTAEYYYAFLKDNEKELEESSMDSHEGWGESELVDQRIRQTVNDITNQDSWGEVSQGVIEIIQAAQIKKMNFGNLIKFWFGNQISRSSISTRKRPNRRTGYMHPGTKKLLMDKWLIVADTSGSVRAELLAKFAGVINQLVEEIPLDFMQCDSEITSLPKPYERKMFNIQFKGRGGTSFDPIIKIVDDRHYKGVIILTDGEASAPPKPKSARVLWVLPEGKKAPVDWGQKVYLSF